jgi:hypothetical protein
LDLAHFLFYVTPALTHLSPIYCFDVLLGLQYASPLTRYTFTMGRRELCPCCLQKVTKAQLKKHAEEATKKQSITAMGRNPTTPATKLRIRPITGNDIFSPQASPPVLVPPPDEGTSFPDTFTGSPPPVTSLLPPIAPYSIQDNDFPPDDVRNFDEPPQAPKSPDYPLMETSDTDEDGSETRDQGESGTEDRGTIQDELGLDGLLDEEYLKQGRSSP